MRYSELDELALLKWLDCCDRVGEHRRDHGPRMTPAAIKAWTPVFAVEATDDEVASAVGCPRSVVGEARQAVTLVAMAGGRGDDTVKLVHRGRR